VKGGKTTFHGKSEIHHKKFHSLKNYCAALFFEGGSQRKGIPILSSIKIANKTSTLFTFITIFFQQSSRPAVRLAFGYLFL
jgi:hypothetical protein